MGLRITGTSSGSSADPKVERPRPTIPVTLHDLDRRRYPVVGEVGYVPIDRRPDPRTLLGREVGPAGDAPVGDDQNGLSTVGVRRDDAAPRCMGHDER
jgi:hypothetical protein